MTAPSSDVLAALAARSMTRAELSAGYVQLAKSSALFRWGYCVSFWMRPSDGRVVLELYPRRVAGRPAPGLPRLTIDSYADQVRLHRALGLGLTAPGEPWDDKLHASPGLFDSQYEEAA